MIVTAVLNPSFAPSINASYMFIFFRIPAIMKLMIIQNNRQFAPNWEYRDTNYSGSQEKN